MVPNKVMHRFCDSRGEPARVFIQFSLQDRFAESITESASKQTYYTIRLLVDRERVADAYRAYAYFRWVDDTLDEGFVSSTKRLAFLERQKSLLEGCYQGKISQNATVEENMLIELVRQDQNKNSWLGNPAAADFCRHTADQHLPGPHRQQAAGHW